MTSRIRICRAEDVPLGEGRSFDIHDNRIAVFRARHGWYALAHNCPHRGGPLADGIVADRFVTCPLHDRRFDLATGQCHTDDQLRVTAYQVEQRNSEIWIEAPEAPRATSLPRELAS